MIYFDESYLTIQYDEKVNTIVSVWKLTPSSAEFRTGMNKLIDAIRDKKTGKIISDTRNLGAIDPTDQEWSTGDWTERAIKAGYQKIGLILSSDIFSQMSVEDVMNNVGGMAFGYFDNIDEAKKWIQK